jgi:hypothetical protein
MSDGRTKHLETSNGRACPKSTSHISFSDQKDIHPLCQRGCKDLFFFFKKRKYCAGSIAAAQNGHAGVTKQLIDARCKVVLQTKKKLKGADRGRRILSCPRKTIKTVA